jgi:Cys-tRNA(Pro)/Cys-tRNA(Cys) deacylase
VALTKAKVEFTAHTYDHDPAARSFGLEAAEALGLAPEQVFKTLLVEVDGKLTVGVVPVDKQLDLKAIAAATGGKKAVMADPAAAERTTGYVVGGISPIGQKRALPTVIDETATDHDTVYVSGGRRGLDLGLAPADLITVTKARTAAIARSVVPGNSAPPRSRRGIARHDLVEQIRWGALVAWSQRAGHQRDDLAHGRVGRPDHGDSPAEPMDVDAVGDLEHLRHVMADQHHRQTPVADPPDQVEHLAGLLDTEGRGRLVHDHHPAAEHRRPRDRHRLPLTTRQRLHQLADVLHGFDAEGIELFLRLLPHRGPVEQPEHRSQRSGTAYLAAEEEVRRDVHRRSQCQRLVHGLDPGVPGVER